MVGAILAVCACNSSFHFDDPRGDGGVSQCTKDADCSHIPGLRCDAASGACVACLSSADCATVGDRCDVTRHICVECTDNDDCREHQRCDLDSDRCLDTCHDADDVCPIAGFACDATKQLCVECELSASCAGSARGPRCDPSVGLCVECLASAQCPAAVPVCDRRQGTCVGCVTAADCGPSSACDPPTATCTAL